MHGNLIHSMARDLHIGRIQDEDDAAYARRVMYSALRYWIMAYALDDGFGGSFGVSEDTIIRKASRWFNEMREIQTGTSDDKSRKRERRVCSLMLEDMVAIGDLVQAGSKITSCVEEHVVAFAPGMSAVLGFRDPTTPQDEGTFVSGALTLMPSKTTEDGPELSNVSVESPSRTGTARFEELDEFHLRLTLNATSHGLPLPCRQWLEMISWPDFTKAESTRSYVLRRELRQQCEWFIG